MCRRSLTKIIAVVFVCLSLAFLLNILSQGEMSGSGLGERLWVLHQEVHSMNWFWLGVRLIFIGLCMGVGWKPLLHRLTRHHPTYPLCANAWECKRWPLVWVWVIWDVVFIERLLG